MSRLVCQAAMALCPDDRVGIAQPLSNVCTLTTAFLGLRTVLCILPAFHITGHDKSSLRSCSESDYAAYLPGSIIGR